uniref:Ribosomal protein S4 n=1 Tax=Karenia brevis TaxID=156230 RepID=A0A0S2QDB8_KARBR|nr:ribosomal protein S4 [Karenia brevis]
MSRYVGAKLRITRRLGPLPGFCKKQTRRTYVPGEHGYRAGPTKGGGGRGAAARGNVTLAGKRLLSKQQLLYNYGLRERQLRAYVKASSSRSSTMLKEAGSSIIDVVLEALDRRLDTVVYRALSTTSIRAARQIVSHGHVKVNSVPVTIPSYSCQTTDTVEIKKAIVEQRGTKARQSQIAASSPKEDSDKFESYRVATLRDAKKPRLNKTLIAEFYSRLL